MGRSLVLPNPIGRTPVDISSLYIQHLLQYARQSGMFSDRDELTITVPASFTTNQRRDTLLALDMAAERLNLALAKEKRGRVLISEPVAALLAFLARDLQNAEAFRHIDLDRNPLVLVYDMGGGTLDLTLVRLGWRETGVSKTLRNVLFEIRELYRYNQFAGENFDVRVAEFLLEELIARFPELEQFDLTNEQAHTIRFRLIQDAERLKRELNSEISWSGDDAVIGFTSYPVRLGGKDYRLDNLEVTASDYRHWVEPFLAYRQDLANALYPIEAVLSRTGLKIDDVDYFLLVGGMGRFLPLQDVLRSYWKRDETFLIHSSPDHAVAEGAAIYSYLKTTYPDFVIDEPSADAYYVRRSRGFDLLLGRGIQEQGEKREYELLGEGERLRLKIFAGESPPVTGSIENIYPSLVYQGGVLIPLGKSY